MACLARLPDGRRKQELQQRWDDLLQALFPGRVWAFNGERMGKPIATAAAVIAATVLARDNSLATRNLSDFADLGLRLINPWEN